jgi:hypothetical protein
MVTAVFNGFTYDLDTPNIELDGISNRAAAFTVDEARLWDLQFNRLFASGNDPVSALYRSYQGHLFAAARIAKSALNEPVFAGVEGGASQMVMQELQAWHLLRTTASTETPATGWAFSLTTGSDYWIGYDTNNLVAANVDKDICPVVIGIADLTATRQVRMIKFKIGDTDHKPCGVERNQLAANGFRVPVMPIKTLIFTPRTPYSAQTYCNGAVTTGELRLIGISYGLGSLLTNMYKSTVSL